MKHKIVLLSLISLFLFSGTLQAQKEFPVWDEGVFAEVAKRHGEKASARLRDVYQFIIVHLNEPVEAQLEAVRVIAFHDEIDDWKWKVEKIKEVIGEDEP